VLGRIPTDYHLDRITRFHPTTVVLALAWMKIVGPLSQWFDPPQLLRAMSAAIGVVGLWAATSAFAAVMSRGHAALFGIIYALSLGVWYFASIEESKIVTATLSALYIAGYLHLRQSWSGSRVFSSSYRWWMPSCSDAWTRPASGGSPRRCWPGCSPSSSSKAC
jgi:hypothetical protein